jgi:Domain of unknown function (DUF5655)/Domain of unknown function (DUF4287)
MATVDEGLQSQIRNIEATYGRSMADWTELIRASGRSRHGEIVTWLKSEHGLTHGSANRVALVALAANAPQPAGNDPEAALYAGPKQALRPIHDRLMAVVRGVGPDIEIAPKKGYLSLRRRTQFAMLKPAANHVDLGLVLPGVATGERLESAATFNALFTHRVRVRSVDDIDPELIRWIGDAYARAG